MDGTYKIGADGEPLQTYDNTDIQTFARVWTGFQRHGTRSNYEGSWWNPNKIGKWQDRIENIVICLLCDILTFIKTLSKLLLSKT